jgi:uncharacterized hydrophobic protein (TIGR00341 family)
LALRLIQIVLPAGERRRLETVLAETPLLGRWSRSLDDDLLMTSAMVSAEHAEALLDSLEGLFSSYEEFRAVVLEPSAVVPKPPPKEPAEEPTPAAPVDERARFRVSREEIYEQISQAAEPNRVFVAMVSLSSVVACIGLLQERVAVVIGAMVIAPLLGPNLALALGIAIGDRPLVWRALATSAAGLALAVVLAACVPLFVTVDLTRGELAARTAVGYDSVALALASGVAASLSLTTGLSSTLVGVMVAVALLPPAATLGIGLAAGDFRAAGGAALLLAVNVVSVNLAANLVFLAQGIRPRTWWERKDAHQSVRLTVIGLSAALVALIVLITFGQVRH